MKNLLLIVEIINIDTAEGDEETAAGFMKGWLRAATWAGLTGNQKKLYNFKGNQDASDIIVSEAVTNQGIICPKCGGKTQGIIVSKEAFEKLQKEGLI